MRVGVTGHQHRPGIVWSEVGARISAVLASLPRPLVGLSCLAGGSDQVFARAVLEHGGSLEAVIPIRDYRDTMELEDAESFDGLIAAAAVFELDLACPREAAFFAAGRWIVDRCDVMIAVWDGKPAAGTGGTADVVAYAREVGRTLVVLDVKPEEPSGEEVVR